MRIEVGQAPVQSGGDRPASSAGEVSPPDPGIDPDEAPAAVGGVAGDLQHAAPLELIDGPRDEALGEPGAGDDVLDRRIGVLCHVLDDRHSAGRRRALAGVGGCSLSDLSEQTRQTVQVPGVLGRRRITAFRVLRPLLGAAAITPFFIVRPAAGGWELALEAGGVLLGGTLGIAAARLLPVEWDFATRRAYTRAGVGYAALWIAVSAARYGFAHGARHLFRHPLADFMTSERVSAGALTDALIFVFVTMYVVRSLSLLTPRPGPARPDRSAALAESAPFDEPAAAQPATRSPRFVTRLVPAIAAAARRARP